MNGGTWGLSAPVTRTFVVGWTLVVVGALAVLIWLIWLAAMVLAPSPVRLQRLPWAVTNDPVPAGSAVELAVSVCNDTSEPVVLTVSRALVSEDDEVTLHLPSTVSAIRPGCSGQVAAQELPANVVPGRYRLEGVVLAQSGQRAVHLPWQSRPFAIARQPGATGSKPPPFVANVTCGSFATWQQAQAAYLAGARRLDGDGDGIACESLRTRAEGGR